MALPAIVGLGVFAALRRTRLPVLRINFRHVESGRIWSRLALQRPREIGRYQRLNPPRDLVCIGAAERGIPAAQVSVRDSETEPGRLLYVVSSCMFACMSSWIQATAVYARMRDRVFPPTSFHHFGRFLPGVPTESLTSLHRLLRRIKNQQTPAPVYLWCDASNRTIVHAVRDESADFDKGREWVHGR